MRRIAVSLLKGGVAKSETSVHLAHGLALAGFKVLLVDTDVQSHCAEMLGVKPPAGLAQVIAQVTEPLQALHQARENLWLLAGGNELAGVKMEIARREIAPESVLADALEHFEGGFDFLVMDTAPGWDTLLVNALYASQDVLSPVSMEPMALSGLKRFEERLAIIQKYNQNLKLRWILPTFVDGRVRKTTAILKQLQKRYARIIAPPIKYSARLSEATAFGRTIFEHDPKGIGAQGYRNLVRRVALDCTGVMITDDALMVTPPAKPAPPAAKTRPPVVAEPEEPPAAQVDWDATPPWDPGAPTQAMVQIQQLSQERPPKPEPDRASLGLSRMRTGLKERLERARSLREGVGRG